MSSFNIMASSAHELQQHQLPNPDNNIIAAPPPTPSAQPPNTHLVTSAADADVLSRLLHRLPPTLSLPIRRSPPPEKSPPVISLSDPDLNDLSLSASSELGFFQLTNHNIPSQLANTAELESLSLFELSKDQKESCFPRSWPLGYDDEEGGNGESFWLDSACSTESTEFSLSSLRELTRALQRVGLETIDMLSRATGFDNPFKDDPARYDSLSLMCIHQGLDGVNKAVTSCGFYPYVIGLQYQIRCQKYFLLADSGWITVMPQVDSVMVTIGDIAQVWSNGKLKKVRGRPMACNGDECCISMLLLITLPTESTISPLLPKGAICGNENENEIEEDEEHKHDNIFIKRVKRMFTSFSFEDYAWRVSREPLFSKDPLDKYRI